MAVHAVDLMVAFPIIERLGEIAPTMPAEMRIDAEGLLSAGKFIGASMLASAHGESVSGYALPSLTQLNQWRHTANLAAGMVNRADPNFILWYLATLAPDQQRLVRSMVAWAG